MESSKTASQDNLLSMNVAALSRLVFKQCERASVLILLAVLDLCLSLSFSSTGLTLRATPTPTPTTTRPSNKTTFSEKSVKEKKKCGAKLSD